MSSFLYYVKLIILKNISFVSTFLHVLNTVHALNTVHVPKLKKNNYQNIIIILKFSLEKKEIEVIMILVIVKKNF